MVVEQAFEKLHLLAVASMDIAAIEMVEYIDCLAAVGIARRTIESKNCLAYNTLRCMENTAVVVV